MSDLSLKIKRAMKNAGLTQITLAEKLGISQGELSRRINSSSPPEEFLDELATALSVEPESLSRISKAAIQNAVDAANERFRQAEKSQDGATDKELLTDIRDRLDLVEKLLYRVLTKLDNL